MTPIQHPNRRDFLKTTAAAGAAATLASAGFADDDKKPAQTILPRWRGFNILNFFHSRSDCKPLEKDFQIISDLGFDFARIPMCYLLWVHDRDPYKIKESTLEQIDRVVEYGKKYGIHVSLNFHRAPGFSVNREIEEPFNLWKDPDALKAFQFHWELFAKRYQGIPSKRLSFDLVNEPMAPKPGVMDRSDYERVARAAVASIRKIDPERLILADGISWGSDPMPELADLKIGQSTRGYTPHTISHYKASWVNSANFPNPAWPTEGEGDKRQDRAYLEKFYEPWAQLARQGVGVHCGECGCYNKTPHPVFLAWFRDVLEILVSHNIGWGLWNLRGSFGVLDSDRADVPYEDFRGHKLDRKLLDLLQEL